MTREDIFDLLHKKYGVCPFCGKSKNECNETGNSSLPDFIRINTDWLWKELSELEIAEEEEK